MSTTASPDQLDRLNAIKARVLANEEVSDVELKEAIEITRAWRAQRTVAARDKPSKAKAPAKEKPKEMTMEDLNALFAKAGKKDGESK